MFGVYLVFSSCFKQNIVVIVSRCSRKPACYRNDVAASCFTADCESSGLTLISYLFLKQKRRFSIKLLKICTCCLVSFAHVHSQTFSNDQHADWSERSKLTRSIYSWNQKLYMLPSVTPAAPFQS